MESQCKKCGILIPTESPKCPSCGEIQDTFHYKSRIAAAALALFGGIFGFHRFFLGQWWGIFYLLLCWTYIPFIVGLIEGIVFLCTSQDEWNKKYNQGVSAGKEKGTVVVVIAVLFPLSAIFGIFAAIAIPAYQSYIQKAQLAETHMMTDTVMMAVEIYALSEQKWPESIEVLDLSGDLTSSQVRSMEVDNGVIYVHFNDDSGVYGNLVITPESTGQGISWDCSQSTVEYTALPSKCRMQF